MVFYKTTDAADFKYRVTGPASPTHLAIRPVHHVPPWATPSTFYRTYGAWSQSISSLSATSSGYTNTEDTYGHIVIEGILHNGSNSGNVTFGWSQDTSNASNTTVLAGSYVMYKAV